MFQKKLFLNGLNKPTITNLSFNSDGKKPPRVKHALCFSKEEIMKVERVFAVDALLQKAINIIHGHDMPIDLRPDDYLITCMYKNQVIGYLYSQRFQGHINALYVLKKYRESKELKVGFMLLCKYKKDAREKKIPLLVLGVVKGNQKGLDFFVRNGFSKIDVNKQGITKMQYDNRIKT
jgi:hypothetical protein